MSDKKLSVVDVVNLVMVGGALLNGVLAIFGIQQSVAEANTVIAQIPAIADAAVQATHSAVTVANEVRSQVDAVIAKDVIMTPIEVDTFRLSVSGAILAFTKPITSILRLFRR